MDNWYCGIKKKKIVIHSRLNKGDRDGNESDSAVTSLGMTK